MIRADDKIVCQEYIDWIHTMPCCACPRQEAEAHHLIHRGWRDAKRNDFSAVPLCRRCHEEYHKVGLLTFNARIDGDLWQIAALLLVEFFLTQERPEVTVGKRLQGVIP